MKKRISTKVKIIFLAAVAIAILANVSSAVLLGRAPIHSDIIGIILSPVRTGVEAAANKLEQLSAYITDFDNLKAENAQLKKQLSDTQSKVRQAEQASNENARLRQLLDIKEKYSDLKFETANIISKANSNWGSTFTIGKGTMDGLKSGMCVVDDDGNVVGQISEAGTDWSTVTTIIDETTEIGAELTSADEMGMAEGDIDLMKSGEFKLSYLSKNSKAAQGDEVVTAGGSVYPAGLLLGTIKQVSVDEAGASKSAVITPAADLGNLVEVFVVTEFNVQS